MEASRLGIMLFVALFLIAAGLNGKLGSMIATIIDPSALQEKATS